MADAREYAELEYDLLGQYGKFVLLYCGLLAALHKHGHPSADRPSSRAEFAARLGDLAPRFFGKGNKGNKPKQIRATNRGTQRRLARFLIETHDRFAAENDVPPPLQKLRERLAADRSLAEQLGRITIELGSNQPPVQFRLEDEGNGHSGIIAPLMRIAQESKGANTFHPDMPGIPLSHELALGIEYSGFVEAEGEPAWKKTGIFSVIREARGPYTNESGDINLIVRDVLWMRRCVTPATQLPLTRKRRIHCRI